LILEKDNRKWEVLFTGTSIANIQAAVQAGMGLSVLPKGAAVLPGQVGNVSSVGAVDHRRIIANKGFPLPHKEISNSLSVMFHKVHFFDFIW
jgi:hypothetical protein